MKANTKSDDGSGLRQRTNIQTNLNINTQASQIDSKYGKPKMSRTIVQKLDMFPKVERDLTVQTNNGGLATIVGYFTVAILVLAEYWSWKTGNNQTSEHFIVDTSLGEMMRVDINLTFPSLHCDDLHIDLMDVAGDVQLNAEDKMIKKRLQLDGSYLSVDAIEAETNAHHQEDAIKYAKKLEKLGPNYCGECYGAEENAAACCNSCDELLNAYKKKGWNIDQVRLLSEQCIRDGQTQPKKMSIGEGCEIAGHMIFNRVAGNFHIAMGEGVERNGRHIHSFLPDDTPNFNSSHIINELKFGPAYETVFEMESRSTSYQTNTLDGVRKIVTEEDGITGLFQYFIKIVPTTYKGKGMLDSLSIEYDDNEIEPKKETNRYFSTERFRPLMVEVDDEHWELGGEIHNQENSSKKVAGVHVGGENKHSHSHNHHKEQQGILPGVFFIYQIYPFAVEVSKDVIPVSHLLIRIMATFGGVFTIVGWLDYVLYSQEKLKGNL